MEIVLILVCFSIGKASNCNMIAGDIADLIFVFFDPIGQALCKRTLNIVERISETKPERMRFYLSKGC